MHTYNTKLKNINIGPLPPPIGGVSMHLFRAMEFYNIPCIDVAKEGYKKSFIKMLSKYDIIYLHDLSIRSLIILLPFIYFPFWHKELYVVNHNYSFFKKDKQKHYRWRKIIKNIINKSNKILIVNESLRIETSLCFPDKDIVLFDPFIPPDVDKEKLEWLSYPSQFKDLIAKYETIISAVAWKLSIYEGVDLYGFDLLIELVKRIKNQIPSLILVFGLADNISNINYLNIYKEKIKDYGIEENIYILTGQKQMWPIIKASKLFIRPTYIDGDPISIKEALYFGVKVIASDCTIRDKRVITFKNRDINSLVNTVLNELLTNYR